MKKGFTLIELITVIAILAIFISVSFIVGRALTRPYSPVDEPIIIDYEYENYRIAKAQAEEMRRANDLREQELLLQKQKK